MPDTGIYLLTGAVGSGKTTALLHWTTNRNDVAGILSLQVEGKRMFFDLQHKERFPMEAADMESGVVSVGRYRFSKNNFEKATQILRNALLTDCWLIIDEIGPLELRGEGFHDVLKETLQQRKNKLLLVVREGLSETVMDYFGIEAGILTAEELQYLAD